MAKIIKHFTFKETVPLKVLQNKVPNVSRKKIWKLDSLCQVLQQNQNAEHPTLLKKSLLKKKN